MRRQEFHRKAERGVSTAEMAMVGLLFFTIIFGIIEFGRLLYTHNALTDATRRGARFAVVNNGTMNLSETDPNRVKVKNYVVYGANITYDEDGKPNSRPLINGLTTDMVKVTYEGVDHDGDAATDPVSYGTNLGTVNVRIEGYTFDLAIPLVGRELELPEYSTTLIAESAGYVPAAVIP